MAGRYFHRLHRSNRPSNSVSSQSVTMDSHGQQICSEGLTAHDLEFLRKVERPAADHGRCQPCRHFAVHPAGSKDGAGRLSRHSQLHLISLPQRCHRAQNDCRQTSSRCSSRRCAAAAAGGASARCSATARTDHPGCLSRPQPGRQGHRRAADRDQHDRPRAAAAAQSPFPPGGHLDSRDVRARRARERQRIERIWRL